MAKVKKKMKKRTVFTIISIVAVLLLGIYMVLCSRLGWEYPPESFVSGWFAFWGAELFLLAGIKVMGDKQ